MIGLRKTLQLLLFGLSITVSIAHGFNDCFMTNDNYKCRLGCMTPYRLIANKNDSELRYSGCDAKKIWMLIRHGTRYPGRKWTSKMMTKLPNMRQSILKSHSLGQGNLSDRDIELLQEWKFGFSNENVMNLAEEGEKELVGIAERFQSRFPSIMTEIYNNDTHTFKYTATQRTEESAKSFALGLFGRKQSLDIWYPQPESRDPVLRFYKLCKRWRVEIDKSPESYRENEKFVKSSTVNELLIDVSKRTGLVLDYDSVQLIYKMCAFESAWYENYNSAWCNLLTLNNFKVLEFAKDLQYYWVDGYGYSLTYEQACNAITDMFNFFESENKATTKAYFTHSGALLKILALLGIAREEKGLRHDSFLYEDNRVWRTSLIDSFASNIAFIYYDCKIQGPSILFMHQERVVQLDGCPVEMPCPLSTMRNKYPDHEGECRFDEMCAI